MNRISEKALFVCVVVITLASSSSLFAQGKLGKIRDKVRETQSKPERSSDRPHREPEREHRVDHDRRSDNNRNRSRSRRSSRGRNRRRNCDRGVDLLLGGSFFSAPAVETVHVVHHNPTPIVHQPVLVEPALQQVTVPNPVVSPEPIYQEVISEPQVFTTESIAWGVRLSALAATDFDDISQGSFGLLLQSPNGLGLDTSVTMIRESGMSFRDHLFLGDVNFVYEPIFRGDFRLRIGVGVNWLGDSYGGDAGFNMTSGFDWRLTERATITGEVDFGSIGDTYITHARIGIGRLVSNNTEWVVGYDNLDIGGVTIGSAFTGLQFRF